VVEVWTVKKILNWTKSYLKKYGIENPRIDAEYFLSEILDTSRMGVYLNFDRPLSSEELDSYKELIKRRKDKEPIQYIINKASFMGFEFFVKKGCFIPRFSTEKLVEVVLDHVKEINKSKINILEIGGGSGAISISIAKLNKKTNFDVYESEKIPIEVMKRNIKDFELEDRIKVIENDYFKDKIKCSYDFVISNPPYIGREEKKDLDAEVREYEPEKSLYAGNKGFDFYKRFVKSMKLFNEDTLFFFEIGYNQKKDVKNIFENEGYNTNIYKDLDKKDRIIKIYKRGEKDE